MILVLERRGPWSDNKGLFDITQESLFYTEGHSAKFYIGITVLAGVVLIFSFPIFCLILAFFSLGRRL